MKNFAIRVDTTSSKFVKEVEAKGNILVKFFILIDEWAFPSSSWLDFPLIVLTWWLQGYLELLKTNEPVNNTFMNGPFEFVTTIKESAVVLTFNKRTIAGIVEVGIPIELSLNQYQQGLIDSAEFLLAALDKFSASGRDLDNFRTVLTSVHNASKR